jgi:hypothetical protein
MSETQNSSASPPLVTICAWLIPGWGYFLIGERGRALASGIAIVALFLAGILVGGIRIMDPPGWGQFGYMSMLVQRFNPNRQVMDSTYTRVDPSSAEEAHDPAMEDGDRVAGSALFNQPVSELGDKPWYVGQLLCGPITLFASAISIHAAHPLPPQPGMSSTKMEKWPSSHSRSWEIGTLYTAVAGMLNLLVIIDSAYRAAQPKQ